MKKYLYKATANLSPNEKLDFRSKSWYITISGNIRMGEIYPELVIYSDENFEETPIKLQLVEKSGLRLLGTVNTPVNELVLGYHNKEYTLSFDRFVGVISVDKSLRFKGGKMLLASDKRIPNIEALILNTLFSRVVGTNKFLPPSMIRFIDKPTSALLLNENIYFGLENKTEEKDLSVEAPDGHYVRLPSKAKKDGSESHLLLNHFWVLYRFENGEFFIGVESDNNTDRSGFMIPLGTKDNILMQFNMFRDNVSGNWIGEGNVLGFLSYITNPERSTYVVFEKCLGVCDALLPLGWNNTKEHYDLLDDDPNPQLDAFSMIDSIAKTNGLHYYDIVDFYNYDPRKTLADILQESFRKPGLKINYGKNNEQLH